MFPLSCSTISTSPNSPPDIIIFWYEHQLDVEDGRNVRLHPLSQWEVQESLMRKMPTKFNQNELHCTYFTYRINSIMRRAPPSEN
jgi:hypothetical protein